MTTSQAAPARPRAKTPWLWGLMAVLSVLIAAHGLSYLVLGRAHLPPFVAANGFSWPYMILVHAGGAGLALLLGPWQFLRGLRAKRPRLHRWIGRGYVAACAVGGIAGGLIAPYASSGPIAAAGFLTLALLWLFATFSAYRAATQRNFVAHERWTIRSFALTLAAVTLRIYLPLAAVLAIPPTPAYIAVAWLAWVPNILIAEVWLRSRGPARG